MKRDFIEINKDVVPYSFDIVLGAEWYNFEVHYNERCDLFTVTLSKNGEVLVYNEPVIYGVTLFADLYQSGKHPMLDIVPYDESEQENTVTWDNLNETVFLTIKQGDDDE